MYGEEVRRDVMGDGDDDDDESERFVMLFEMKIDDERGSSGRDMRVDVSVYDDGDVDIDRDRDNERIIDIGGDDG